LNRLIVVELHVQEVGGRLRGEYFPFIIAAGWRLGRKPLRMAEVALPAWFMRAVWEASSCRGLWSDTAENTFVDAFLSPFFVVVFSISFWGEKC
jgi:uncharacterized protein (DUF2062 family)